MKQFTYIDLFAGAGGLSEGFTRAGFKPIAHVEMNKDACDTIKARTTYHWLNENITTKIYQIAIEQWNNGNRSNLDELPKRLIKHSNTDFFVNRFQVANGKGVSLTVVTHIAMEGHYYIHSDKKQNRSISVREAARILSFPDDYFFGGSWYAAFKQLESIS